MSLKRSGTSTGRWSSREEGCQLDPEYEQHMRDIHASDTPVEDLLQELAKHAATPGNAVGRFRYLIHENLKIENEPGNSEHAQYPITILRAMFQLPLQTWAISETTVAELVSLGMTEIRHFSSRSLSKTVSEYCIPYMKENVSKQLPDVWIDMFGKVVAALSTRGDIPHETDILDGKEFRKYIVQQICLMDWTKKIVVSLMKLLEEIPGIDTVDVDMILDKLCHSLNNMHFTTVGEVINRAVNLTGSFRSAVLLDACDKYFGTATVFLKELAESEVDQPGVRHRRDIGKKMTFSTAAFHFVDASRHCEPIVREVLKRVRASVHDHTLVMTPFVLAVALGMTSVDYLRQSIVEPLKVAIIKSYYDMHLGKESLWYKDTRGDLTDEIKECFQAVLQTHRSSLEYLSEGLRELGIGLLNTEGIQWKYPMTAKKCSELGTFLILTVTQSDSRNLGLVLNELLKYRTTPNIECLASCLAKYWRTVGNAGFQERISELLQHLPAMTVESVSLIIKSLMPAIQMSPTLLDELMMVLRKTFWKSETSGRICVEAMCVILSNSLVVGSIDTKAFRGQGEDLLFSQCTQSGSQSMTKSDKDNSPLCFEILNLAKRFFLLSCKVREQLYLGLHRASRSNPMLAELICGQLLTHVSKYMPAVALTVVNEHSVTLKHLFEFSSSNLSSVEIKDDLGFLVQCVGFVIQSGKQDLEGWISHRSCKDMMLNWVTFTTKIDMNTLEIIASSILGDAEGSRPLEIARFVKDVLVMQTMQVIESLIEYIAISTNTSDLVDKSKEIRNAEKKVGRLFDKYQELEKKHQEELIARKTKSVEKAGGSKGKKKKAEKIDDSDNDAASIASDQDNFNPAKKLKKMDVLAKPVYYHLINLDSVCLMLRSVYGVTNDPKTITRENKALEKVKDEIAFELLLLETVKQKIIRLVNKQSIRERLRAPGDIHNSLSLICKIIWKRFLAMTEVRLGGFTENIQVVESRLEIVVETLKFFYKERLVHRILNINDFCGQKEDSSTPNKVFFGQWKAILKLVTAEFEGIEKHGNSFLFDILTLVCTEANEPIVLEEIRGWTWKYLKEDPPTKVEGSQPLLQSVVSAFSACENKLSNFSTTKDRNDILRLAKSVRYVIGDALEGYDDKRREPSWLITGDTAPALVFSVISFMETQLLMINSIISRGKAHGQYLDSRIRKTMTKNCYQMLDFVYAICSELVRTGFQTGPWVTALLKVAPAIYSATINFFDYLLDLFKKKQDVQVDRYEPFVQMIGKEFKNGVELMINHTEYVQRAKLDELLKEKGKIPPATKAQFAKDAKLIANIIYQIERFEQQLLLFSKKTQSNLLEGIKLSTARDFRIETSKFKEALARKEEDGKAEKTKGKKARKAAVPDETIDAEESTIEPEEEMPKKGKKRKQAK